MKVISGILLVAVCLVASIHAFPGARDSDSDEKNTGTVLILPSDQLMGTDLEDDSSENSFWNWNGIRTDLVDRWYSSIRAHMRRLLNQMAASVMSGISYEDGVPRIKMPEGANITSTSKVVDGHVVTVNETTYTEGDDENGLVIRVRVIDVRPENETVVRTDGDVEVTTLPADARRRTTTDANRNEDGARSVETVEDLDNEIRRNQVETLNA